MLTQLTFKRNVSGVNIRSYRMNSTFMALGMLTLATTPALSAGFERLLVPDLAGPPLEAGIWYPSDAPVSSHRLGLYRQTVALGGAVAGQNLPLTTVSHCTGGGVENQDEPDVA